MCLCLLKISMLEELLIGFRICLVIEGGWFEEVCMKIGVLLSFL